MSLRSFFSWLFVNDDVLAFMRQGIRSMPFLLFNQIAQYYEAQLSTRKQSLRYAMK